MATAGTPQPEAQASTQVQSEQAQPKPADVFAQALRDKAKTEPYKHDSYIGSILNCIADVVESVSSKV